MATADYKQQLLSAAQAVSTAVLILKSELPIIEAFLKEASDMENFGHIVDQTLYRDPERRAASAVVTPLFKSAVDLVRAYDRQLKDATAALAKVNAR